MTDDILSRKRSFLLPFFFALFLGGCASVPAGNTDANKALADRWGIEVQAIRLTAGDHMIDFRYRVLDAEKAAQVIRPQLKPFLIEPTRGARLSVPVSPKIGPISQTRARPVTGRSYFIFFVNAGRAVKPGDRVTVVMNDLRIEDLVVQ